MNDKKNIVFRYELDGELLKDTDSTSYFGVELSADMKWNYHVKKVTANGNTMLGIVRRNLKNWPKNLKDLAYQSLLRPKLKYACSTWDPYTTKNIKYMLHNRLHDSQHMYIFLLLLNSLSYFT